MNKEIPIDDRERAEFAESVMEKLGLREQDFLFISAKRHHNIDLLVRRIADILPDAMQDAFIAQQRADLALKDKRVRALVYSKATLCGAVALSPLPVADMAVITPIQIAMVAAIGYFHGVTLTKERITEFLGVLGAGFGLREASRQLVKLIPGVGSVVSSAVAFAGTVALGESANVWFKRKMNVPADELREMFKQTAESARSEYERHRHSAEAAGPKVADLERRRKEGLLSDAQFNTLLGQILDAADRQDDP